MTKPRWFLEYCEKTTLPCMKYFTMKHGSLLEKLVKQFSSYKFYFFYVYYTFQTIIYINNKIIN